MAHYGLKINKSEKPDKTPYSIYYPHSLDVSNRKWTQDYIQVVSMDPATKNFALRIEKRYFDGRILPVVFDKVSLKPVLVDTNESQVVTTYESLTDFLNKYYQYYLDCHFIIIERQLPQNYRATRIAQHTISYFSIMLHDKPLLPSIIELDPKIKGKVLGAPKNIGDKQLKTWAIMKARELLTMRQDEFSIGVLNYFSKKQDDLSDTVCQAEALFILWGYRATEDLTKPKPLPPPVLKLELPTLKLPKLTDFVSKAPTNPASSVTKLTLKINK